MNGEERYSGLSGASVGTTDCNESALVRLGSKGDKGPVEEAEDVVRLEDLGFRAIERLGKRYQYILRGDGQAPCPIELKNDISRTGGQGLV